MKEFKLMPKEQENLKAQLSIWKKRLNLFVSPIAFTGAATAIASTEYRKLIAWLTILFLGSIYFYARHEFPKIIDELRNKERTYREEIILRGIVSYYFGWPGIFKHFPAYLFSAVLLAMVAAGALEKIGI